MIALSPRTQLEGASSAADVRLVSPKEVGYQVSESLNEKNHKAIWDEE